MQLTDTDRSALAPLPILARRLVRRAAYWSERRDPGSKRLLLALNEARRELDRISPPASSGTAPSDVAATYARDLLSSMEQGG